MPRADPPRLPHGVSLCLEQSLRFLQQLNQHLPIFVGLRKWGSNWRFGACLHLLGFFRKNRKNLAVPRVIIVMNTIPAPGGTHGSL